MGERLLLISVTVLFAWSVGLALFTVSMRSWDQRRRRHWNLIEEHWRDPVQEYLFSGEPLPLVPGKARRVVLELLLRYLALLRGDEAQRIVTYLEDSGHVGRAVEQLRARSRWRRAAAAGLLGRMRSPLGVQPLIVALHDGSEDVRSAAARGLAAIGDPDAVAALAAALGDPSRWTVSTVAVDLLEMSTHAVPALLKIAESDNHGAAVTAVRVLGEIRDPQAAPPLLRQLRSPDIDMRAQAAAALGKMGNPRAIKPLQAALKDREWQVRAQAATALGALDGPDTVAALSAAIVDESWWVRRNCGEALAHLGHPGRRALITLSSSPDRYVRDRCLAILETLDPAHGPGASPPGHLASQ